jgi:Trk K+ transport system NAD-binding subunit
MRILVVGAGRVGAKVILQLRKNPKLNVVTVDPRENPPALEQGVIDHVDHFSELTLGGLADIIGKEKPDLILVTTSSEDIARTGVPGLDLLVEALRGELEATSSVPIIAVSRVIP